MSSHLEGEQFAPCTDPNGKYEKICPQCGQTFRTNNPRTKYDSLECANAFRTANWLANEANREKHQARARERKHNSRDIG